MRGQTKMTTRRELTAVISQRYRAADRHGKKLILDEFVNVTGYHPKHSIRVLAAEGYPSIADREASLLGIRSALARIAQSIRKAIPGSAVTVNATSDGTRIVVRHRSAQINSSWIQGQVSAPFEIPGNVDNNDAPVTSEKQDDLQHIRAAVMEKIFPPVVDHQFRHKHTDFLQV